jgi:hypothetical protein
MDTLETYQRSSDQWLLQGDINTEYFHIIANGRKRKKIIFSFKDGQKIIQGDPALLNHATEFYKTLFGPQQNSPTRLDANIWNDDEKLNDLDRIEIDRPF